MRYGLVGVGLQLALVVVVNGCAGWDPAREQTMRQEAAETIDVFKEKDPSIERFFGTAYGYAVFPTVGKGGMGIGGAHGKGLVYEQGKVVGRASLTQVTVGFQLGGQSYRELIFFKNEAAMDRFKNNRLELAAQASAVAATTGAAANASYEGGVAVFTVAKGGLMYEASVGGQKFSFEPL